MKLALGNSCSKGCMIYVVALAGILAITVFGLGGISARFGGANAQQPASGENPQPTAASSTNALPAATQAPLIQGVPTLSIPTNIDPNAVLGGILPTPSPAPPLPTMEVQPTVAAPPPPIQSEAIAPVAEATPQAYTPVEAQGGVITGEASTPFYVVQSGDTLWAIATHYGVDVGCL